MADRARYAANSDGITERRRAFRHQAQDMLLVDLVAVSVRPTETFL